MESGDLADNSVFAIHVDQQGGVWLVQQSGLVRFNPGLTRFGTGDNLNSRVNCVTRHGGAIYAGTTTGLYRMLAATGSAPKFERIEGIDNNVWALAGNENELMAATDTGIFLIGGRQATGIHGGTRPVFDLTFSRRDAGWYTRPR